MGAETSKTPTNKAELETCSTSKNELSKQVLNCETTVEKKRSEILKAIHFELVTSDTNPDGGRYVVVARNKKTNTLQYLGSFIWCNSSKSYYKIIDKSKVRVFNADSGEEIRWSDANRDTTYKFKANTDTLKDYASFNGNVMYQDDSICVLRLQLNVVNEMYLEFLPYTDILRKAVEQGQELIESALEYAQGKLQVLDGLLTG
jgi:hypothetical protein